MPSLKYSGNLDIYTPLCLTAFLHVSAIPFQVTISEATMRQELEETKAELEMARVHLVQLRAGHGGGREGEVATLTTELQQVIETGNFVAFTADY